MNTKTSKNSNKVIKKKLCWNCEGNAPLEAENCPYCGVYVSSSSIEGMNKSNDLFAPSYKIPNASREDSIPEPPYSLEKSEETNPQTELKSDGGTKQGQELMVPLILLVTGMPFFLLGFAMWLFAKQNTFILQWNATYWFVYLLLGLSSLGYGWHLLHNVQEGPKD